MRRFMLVGLGVIAIAVTVVVLAAQFRPNAVGLATQAAQTAPGGSVSRTMTIVGLGKITVKPDMAETTIGVRTTADTVAEAMGKANKDIEAVLKALKAANVADSDIQTVGFNVNASHDREGKPSGYEVSNMLRVRIRDMQKVGATIDAAVNAGANQIYGVNFTLNDPDKVQTQARAAAVADAKKQAGELAQAAGVTLGEIVQINNVITGGPRPMYEAKAAGMAQMAANVIQPGEMDVTMQVEIVFGIK